MADKLTDYATNKNTTSQMGEIIEGLMETAKSSRRGFERRWYDNNFFDDGFHFRYLSRQANKIVDLSDQAGLYAPLRAVPKASRQLRGVANLLAGQDPVPVVYPEKITKSNFPDQEQVDPNTGQPVAIPNPEYQAAIEEAKQIAKKSGHWVQEEFKEQDLLQKLSLMALLSGKQGVSYMQVWPDAIGEKIKTEVLDAFDVWLLGELQNIEDSPFIIKTKKMFISQIKANELFDPMQVQKISPDNRHASSEIKDAYMKARYGQNVAADQVASINLRETFIKEYLTGDNEARIRMQEDGERILRYKKPGDVVIRQVYSTGNIWLRDKYINMSSYPIVDFRYEPGSIYQVPMIERFIPQNKSYDMILSRLERILHTTQMGILLHQDGQKPKITNEAGAQMVEYNGAPPTWQAPAQIPSWVFNVLNIMQSNMEEQGVTTSALGRLPSGVKANAAIESLKESEIANLAIATRQFRGTVKRIAEKFLEIADDYFTKPQTVYLLEKGEPQYFDIVGKRAYDMREELGVSNEGVVPLNKYCKVDIQIESQLAYTQEGKKAGVFDQPPQPEKPLEIPYKDVPEDVKRQYEAKAGFKPSEMISPAGTDQAVSEVEAQTKVKMANKPQPKGGATK